MSKYNVSLDDVRSFSESKTSMSNDSGYVNFSFDDVSSFAQSNAPKIEQLRKDQEEEERKRREEAEKAEMEYQAKKENEKSVFSRFLDVVKTPLETVDKIGKGIQEGGRDARQDFGEKKDEQGLGIATRDLAVDVGTDLVAGGARVVGEDIPFYFGSMFYGKGEQEKVRIAREEGRAVKTRNVFTNTLITNELNMAVEGALVQDLKSARLAGDTEREAQIMESLNQVQANRQVDPEKANQRKGVFDERSNDEMIARYSDRTALQVGAGFAELALDVGTAGVVGGKVGQSGKLIKESAIEGATQAGKQASREAVDVGAGQIMRDAVENGGRSVAEGAVAGAGYGAVGAVEEGGDMGDVATGALVGTVAGGAIGGALNFGLTGLLPAMSYSTTKHLGKIPMVQRFQAEQVMIKKAGELSDIVAESVGDFIDVNKIVVPDDTPEMAIRKSEAIMELMQLEGLSVGGRIIDIPEDKMADFNAIQTNILQPIVDELTITPEGTTVDIGAIEKSIIEAKEALDLHGIIPSTRQIAPTPMSVVVDEKIVNGEEPTTQEMSTLRTEILESTGTPEEIREKTVNGLDKVVDDTNRVNTPIEDLEGKSVEYKVGDKTVKGTVEGDTLKLESGRVIPLNEKAKQNILDDADFVDGVAGKQTVDEVEKPLIEGEEVKDIPTKTELSQRVEKLNQSKEAKMTPEEMEIERRLGYDDAIAKRDSDLATEQYLNRERNAIKEEANKKVAELDKRIYELDENIEINKMSLNDDYLKNQYLELQKFTNKSGELPEITVPTNDRSKVLSNEGKRLKDTLRQQIKDAQASGDTARVEMLKGQLAQIRPDREGRQWKRDYDFIIEDLGLEDVSQAQGVIDSYRKMQADFQENVELKNQLLQEKNEAISILADMQNPPNVKEYRKSMFLENQKERYSDLGQVSLDKDGNITEESVKYIKESFDKADGLAQELMKTDYESAKEIALGNLRSDSGFTDTRIALAVEKAEREAGNIELSLEINKRLSIEGTQAGQAVKALDTAPGEYSAGKAVRDTYRELYNRKGGKDAVKKSVKEVKESVINSIKSISMKDLKGIIDKNICKV